MDKKSWDKIMNQWNKANSMLVDSYFACDGVGKFIMGSKPETQSR